MVKYQQMPDQYKEPIEPAPENPEQAPEPTEVKPSTEREILAPEEKPEVVKEELPEKEPVSERVERETEKTVPSPPSPPPPLPVKVRQQIKQLQTLDRENQVKQLCDLALQKGLDFAVQIAKGLDSAYTLDEFHDTLVDELYKKLVEEGKLKEL